MENIICKHIRFVIAPAIGSALIGAGGSIVNGLTSLFGGSSSASKDYNRSKKLMQFQNDLNMQNWNTMNAYNTPGAIRQRQRAAGMNPLLHDLEGAAQPMAPLSQSSFTGSAQEQANRQAAISNMTQAANVAAQTALIEKQGQVADATAKNLAAQTQKTAEETAILVKDNLSYYQKQAKDFGFIDAQTKSALSAVGLNDAYSLKAYKEICKIGKDMELTDAAINEINKKLEMAQKLNDAEVNKLHSAAALDFANCALAAANGQLALSQSNLNRQMYRFNEDMNPKRLEEQKQVIENLILTGKNMIKQGKNIDEVTNWYQNEIKRHNISDADMAAFNASVNMDANLGQMVQKAAGLSGAYGLLKTGVTSVASGKLVPTRSDESSIWY